MNFWKLKIWVWNLGIENVKLKAWEWKFFIWKFGFWKILETLKKIFFVFFFFFFRVDSALDEFKCVGAEILPPPPHFLVSLFSFLLHLPSTFYSSIGTIHLLLPFDFSSLFHHFFLQKNTFLSFLTLLIHLHQYFFRSLCFEHFHPTPILVKPIFKNPFSSHQNGFFFSSFSC